MIRLGLIRDCNSGPSHQEMDIESLEAANQSLQVDLKLAFKRIGDLQAAIEDEMESDDNDDLINRYNNAIIILKRSHNYLLFTEMSALIRNQEATGPSDNTSVFFSNLLYSLFNNFKNTISKCTPVTLCFL